MFIIVTSDRTII